jgi:hypothetical protein
VSNNKLKIISLFLLLLFAVTMGCYKKSTLLINDTPAITATVSFSSDIVPLLTANCALSGCHNGTISPDLSSANAYNSLVDGNFVSTSTPSNSLVYLWLTGKESATMPLGTSNNPSNINGYILAWITQGAEKN